MSMAYALLVRLRLFIIDKLLLVLSMDANNISLEDVKFVNKGTN